MECSKNKRAIRSHNIGTREGNKKISRVVVMLLAVAFFCTVVPAGHAAEKVKVGYLHTLAADGQMWFAIHKGCFKEQGVECPICTEP